MKISALLLTAFTSLAAVSAHATHYEFYDDTIVLNDSTGAEFTGNPLVLRFGSFLNGFTATANNVDAWEQNWITLSASPENGFYDPSTPEWTAYFSVNNNTVFAEGTQLFLWVYSPLDGASAEWALLADSAWLIGANNAQPTSSFFYEFTGNTTAVLGEFDALTGLASTSLVGSSIPEPSAFALIGGSLALCIALGRRRRG